MKNEAQQPGEERTEDFQYEQLTLFTGEWREVNPLKGRFDSTFFSAIPKSPGIYWMLGERGELLYVGKAKNLRDRLRSYGNTAPENLSSKTRHLIKKVASIHWDTTETEAAAFIRENELLRTLKPPFNVQNTRPETYLFLSYQIQTHGLTVRLLFSDGEANELAETPGATVHGALKGLPMVIKGHAALLRWLWAYLYQDCSWPLHLTRLTAPKVCFFPWPQKAQATTTNETVRHLEFFLRGELPLPDLLLPTEEPELFLQSLWLEDQRRLAALFSGSLSRHRKLLDTFSLQGRYVSQATIDDLIVFRRGPEGFYLPRPPAHP